MAIVTLEDVKLHLGVTDSTDDDLITGKIDAAQAHLEALLGYQIETEFPPTAEDASTVPGDLQEAVRSLAAHWFENREASVVGVSATETPMSVSDIVRERRHYSFGGA